MLRLLVKDVLVGPEKITIRHRVPLREHTRNDAGADTEGEHCQVRWGVVTPPPCGVPAIVRSTVPSRSTPAVSIDRIKLNTLPSATLSAIRSITSPVYQAIPSTLNREPRRALSAPNNHSRATAGTLRGVRWSRNARSRPLSCALERIALRGRRHSRPLCISTLETVVAQSAAGRVARVPPRADCFVRAWVV